MNNSLAEKSASKSSHPPIQLGPFTLHPAFSNGQFEGIGEVFFEKTPLRSPKLPWTVYTESEAGFRFSHFELLEIKPTGEDAVTIHFKSLGEWLPRVQEADAMGDARIRGRRLERPTADFRWTFRWIREQVWEKEWDGLAMELEIAAPGNPVHWVIEDTTWEIGGEAAGSTLIVQDISTMDLEQTVKADSAFSTIEKFFTDGWGGAYPMDMLPRAAGASICDFQVKGDLALCIFAESPKLTRARLEKFANEDVIHYTDRPFFPLGEKVKSPERKLLVYRNAAPFKRHEWRNLWLDCFTEVRRRILEPYGFEVEIPLPQIHSHLWDGDLHKLGKNWGDDLIAALPEFKRLGYQEVFTHGVWDSITSDPKPVEPGNICCPYQFKFAESFGGDAIMKKMTDAARAEGLEIFQWFSFHLSKHAQVWKDHPDWVLKEANGDAWDGNYGSLWSGRFVSDYGTWMKNQIFDTCKDAGLDGIFWDSYQNLGVTCVDWSSPDKTPQADAIWHFQAELQRKGVRQRCEITTIFGVTNVCVYGFEDDKFRRRLWSDSVRNDDVFALLDTAPGFFSSNYPFTQKGISPEIYFWLVAHRVIPGINARPWKVQADDSSVDYPALPGGDLAEAYADVNRNYLIALPFMKRLRLVEDATHVLWFDEKNETSVIWAFKAAEVEVSGSARELGSGEVVASGKLKLAPGQIWLLGNR